MHPEILLGRHTDLFLYHLVDTSCVLLIVADRKTFQNRADNHFVALTTG